MTTLTDYNRKISSPCNRRICTALVFLLILFSYTLPAARYGELNAPPEIGDGHDYDAIGLQFSKGNGFSINWDDPDYRTPYLHNNQDGRYDFLLNRHGEGPTTYRPPLFPALIALNYRLFGREFWPIRVLNIMSIATACALAFAMLSSRLGVIPGVLCAGWLVNDAPLRAYAKMVMTEAPAVLVTTLICWLLLRTVRTRDWKIFLGLGAVTGLAFLTRSVFALWAPTIGAAVYFLSLRPNTRWFGKSTFFLPVLFVASFIAVSAPWMVRNCFVLGGVEPLGSMGAANLSAAYSDAAYERRGVWFSLTGTGFFDEIRIKELQKNLNEREIAMANYSRQAAYKWIVENPSKVPLLMYFKVRSLWRIQDITDAVLFLFASLGGLCYLLFRPRELFALLALLVACSMATAITWDVGGGRFIVPIRPILAMLAALGLWAVIVCTTEVAMERITMKTTHSDL